MNTYQQPANWGDSPAAAGPPVFAQPTVWAVDPAAVGQPALLQTAAPHLRQGERMEGAFSLSLDPLLPLYFHADRFREMAVWIPFLWLWDILRTLLSLLKFLLVPRWVLYLFGTTRVRYRRQFGLNPFRRLYRTIRRPLHGGSWSGGQDTARQLWQAVRLTPGRYLRIGHDRFVLVVTDQRLLVLSLELGSFNIRNTFETRPLFELPRGSYALRHEVPNSWWTHRIDLAFHDGSWIALEVPGKWTLDGDDAKERVQQVKTLLG